MCGSRFPPSHRPVRCQRSRQSRLIESPYAIDASEMSRRRIRKPPLSPVVVVVVVRSLCRVALALLDLLLCPLLVVLLDVIARVGKGQRGRGHTRALMVPCRACLWFRRNLGSVPLSEGYRCVLGFLILWCAVQVSFQSHEYGIERAGGPRTRSCGSSSTGCAETSSWILATELGRPVAIAPGVRTGHGD